MHFGVWRSAFAVCSVWLRGFVVRIWEIGFPILGFGVFMLEFVVLVFRGFEALESGVSEFGVCRFQLTSGILDASYDDLTFF